MFQADATTSPTDCGSSGHDEECLCDVRVTQPTRVRYGFQDVWHGELIARATGYKEGQGGPALADYLEALAYGYDATRMVANQDDDWLEGTRDPVRRAQIAELLRAGESIIDLPNVLQDSFARILATITQAQPSLIWTWDEAKWARWEDRMLSPREPQLQELSATFGISRKQADTLVELYGRESSAAVAADERRQAEDIFERHPDMTAAEIVDRLAEHGVVATKNAVLKHRQRWRLKRSK